MSATAPLRRSTRERRTPAHLLSPTHITPLAPSVASAPSSSQLSGGSSDGGDQATPGFSGGGKVSKAGQRRQQRTASSHPYQPVKSAAAAALHSSKNSVSVVCDGAGVMDVSVGVSDSGAINGWEDEWSAKINSKKQSSLYNTPLSHSQPHCISDLDHTAIAAMFDESVCPSPFTLHSLPKLPNVLLPADIDQGDCSYSEPLSPVSASSVDESVSTSMSSSALMSRTLSISSSSTFTDDRPRCPYPSHPTAVHHHDHVLGRALYHHPSVDTTPTEALNRVYAMLCLAVLCTGLDLPSVLKRWDDLQDAFEEFDVAKVSAYGAQDVDRLLRHPKVFRDKVKINAIVQNAVAIQRMETAKPGSFLALLWSQHTSSASHADHFPEAERILPLPSAAPSATVPLHADSEVDFAAARTAVVVADGLNPSRAILRLKLQLSGVKLKRMGDAACLQFAQSIGLVNHHKHSCYCWQHCEDEYQQVIELRQGPSAAAQG